MLAKTTTIGRANIEITPALLKKLEKLGASGVAQRWAAQALMMSDDTFIRRRQDNAAFAAAWERGKAKFAEQVIKAAPLIVQGLIKNGITATAANPGGNVSAQLGFIDKVLRRSDVSEEIQGHVDLAEIDGGQAVGPIEIQEVRVRRIRRTGRIEDEFDT